MRVGQQHRQTVDADPFSSRRRHAVTQRPDVINVYLLGDFVAPLRDLRQKTLLLLGGIIQFRETISDFHACRIDFESLRQRWILRLLFRKRRNVGWKIVQDRRLYKFVLRYRLEQQTGPFPVTRRSEEHTSELQ